MNIAKIVREAREQSRLTTLDFATGIFDDFIQLHGDRSFRDDGAVVGGIGWLDFPCVCDRMALSFDGSFSRNCPRDC